LSDQEEPQSEGLPSAGLERVIFLRALQQFSDECETPELQPECPFSVDLPSGGRGCGEECMDLLAKFGDPYSRGGGSTLETVLSRGDGGGSSGHAVDPSQGVGPLMHKQR
jgi:hypothetical protein